ncbi:MAG: hypothetical protein ACRDD1_11500, partial [Planctomycetia bacterium]
LDPATRFTEVRRGEWTINFVIHPSWSSSGPAEPEPAAKDEHEPIVVPIRSSKGVAAHSTPRGRDIRTEQRAVTERETSGPAPAAPKQRKEDARRVLLRNLWEEMSEAERGQLESAALERGSSYLVRQYHEAKERGGSLFESVREVLVYQELQRRLTS